MHDDTMVLLVRVASQGELAVIEGLLVGSGIPHVIDNAGWGAVPGFWTSEVNLARVLVPRDHLEEARALVDAAAGDDDPADTP